MGLVLLGLLAPALVSCDWAGQKLPGPAGETLMNLIQGYKSEELFCALMRRRFLCKDVCEEQNSTCGSCDECAEQRYEEVLQERLALVKALPEQSAPMAVFVLGPVGSGKSSFVKTLDERLQRDLRDLLSQAVHLNADGLRSELLGGEAIYNAMSINNSPSLVLLQQASRLRFEIQKWVLSLRRHYITDSISLPVVVYETFAAAGYECRGFWMDLLGRSLEEKASLAKQRVQARMEHGGHFAKTYPEQIQRSRASAEELRARGLEMQAFLSVDGGFREVRSWNCWSVFEPHGATVMEDEQEALAVLQRLVMGYNQTLEPREGRTLFSEGFTVSFDNASHVVGVAVKRPINATLLELNCAVMWFSRLEFLILDESNVTGALKDLELPLSLRRLQLRYCQVEGQLWETARWDLTSLKLEGKKIRGDLSELNWRHLQWLDLRGANHVTGNLSELRSQKLRGFWVQHTQVSGDITQLLRENLDLSYLDVRRSHVIGSINDEWKEVGQKLTELRLQGSKVTFHMSVPRADQGLQKVKRPFPSLTILDLSDCNLNMHAWDLLLPLMYNDKIVWLAAMRSGLFGELKGMVRYQNLPMYFSLKILNLGENNITNLTGEPLPGCAYSLQGNPLVHIDSRYFRWPAALDLRNSNFSLDDSRFSELLKVNPKTWKGDLEKGWKCDGVQPRAERTSCRLSVSPSTFAPLQLCSCFTKQGWAGEGANCKRCEGHMQPLVYPSKFGQFVSCCACPENKVPLYENGQKLGNSCYRCRGKGCQRTITACTASFNSCADGYRGTLCSYCEPDYFSSDEECVKCDPEDPVRLLRYLALPLFLLVALAALRLAVRDSTSKSGFEQGQRAAELGEQALLLITFLQVAKTVGSATRESSENMQLQQLRLGDLLMLLRLECALGETGLVIERLSSTFLLPVLCSLCLLAGACRGSPFYALKFCIILAGVLFPGTIQATVSNMQCIEADADSLSLNSTDGDFRFLREFPFVKCDLKEYGWLQLALRLAFLLNAMVLPGFLISLAWFINRQVEPLWSACRWLKPDCKIEINEEGFSVQLTLADAITTPHFSLQDLTSRLREASVASLRVVAATHVACLAELAAPEPLLVELRQRPRDISISCNEKARWRHMRPSEKERALRDAHSHAMDMGETCMYRHVSRCALRALKAQALWLGARNTFERFGVADPLLFEGISKLMLFAITSLCVKKEPFLVANCFFLLFIAVVRGKPFGTESRNELALSCYFSLGCSSAVLYVWQDGAPGLQLLLLMGPVLHFLHLQLMHGDTMLRAYQLMDELPPGIIEMSFQVAPVAWPFEKQKCLAAAFNCYRSRARTLRLAAFGLKLRLEEKALALLRHVVSAHDSVRQSLFSDQAPADAEFELTLRSGERP